LFIDEVSLGRGVDSQDRQFDIQSVRASKIQSMKGITEDSNDRAMFVLAVMAGKNVVVRAGVRVVDLSSDTSASRMTVCAHNENRLIA
jgi:hypothetical protein